MNEEEQIEIFADFFIEDEEKFKNSDLSETWEESYWTTCYFGDFFMKNCYDGYELAKRAPNLIDAMKTLNETYSGCDCNGIGVKIMKLYDPKNESFFLRE